MIIIIITTLITIVIEIAHNYNNNTLITIRIEIAHNDNNKNNNTDNNTNRDCS